MLTKTTKTLYLIGILLISGVTTMVQANELTFKEKLELSELKYGPNYLVSTTIPVTISEKIKLQPDMAIFSVRLISQGNNAKAAFNDNAATMTEFRQFLTELNIADDNLKTLSYRNYEQFVNEEIKIKEKDRYRSTLVVSVKVYSKQYFEMVNLLEQYHIDTSQLKSSSSNEYRFIITELSSSATLAKTTVQDRFTAILDKFNKMGINNVDIGDFKTEAVPAQKYKQVKKYFVDNQLQIQLTDFELTGKIIAKIQDLKMTFNNDIRYIISDEHKDKILQQHQSIMFKKLLNQAEAYLGNNQNGYSVGNLISFTPDIYINQNTTNQRQVFDMYDRAEMSSMMKKSAVSIDETKIIQAPASNEVTLSMSGVFEVLAKRYDNK